MFPQAAFAEVCYRDNYTYEALCHFTPDFSVLWYPLVGHLPVGPGDWLVIIYCVAVAAYLGAPLVRSILRDVTEQGAREQAHSTQDPMPWRF